MNQPRPVLPEIAPIDWHGSLCLEFINRQGSTQLIHSQSKAPLKIQRSFYPEGSEVCHSVIVHTAGGMVGGDRLSLNLRFEPNAQALITTAAASKIYKTNGREARQIVQVDVASGACLEWLPQETIVFSQAVYRQEMRINLAPGATWLGWEITRFGRSASGERFIGGEWRSHTEVWQHGRPVWVDRQWFPGSEALFTSPHGLANCPVVGSFAWIGRSVEPELVEAARSVWAGNGEVGVTRLMSGLLCRYRGDSTMEARRWFIEVWRLVRRLYYDRPVCIPRVWQQ